MKGYKKCVNGHFYQESLDHCPHCPDPNKTISSGDLDKTVADYGETFTTGKDLGKTVVEDLEETELNFTDKKSSSSPKIDLSKTHIITDEKTNDESGNEKPIVRERRKLVGWLVSYTIDELGRDYRLYEGKNTIGTATNNDIILNADPSISAQHATILYRDNMFYIKDHYSTNGIKVSGKSLDPDETRSIEDNCRIEIGNTIFLFKSSL